MHAYEVSTRIDSIKIRKKKTQTERERLRANRGIDVPMPMKRAFKAEDKHHIAGSMDVPVGSERAFFKPGSVFDTRFPHILNKQASPTADTMM